MRYLADILTLARFVLALVLFGLIFFDGTVEAAFVIFLVAVLTDAFDGTCARKWPFKKSTEPWYRKYAAKYDMLADVLLATAQVLFLAVQVNLVVGMVIIVYYLISSIGGDLLVYGKILGHPDDCSKKSLMRRNFALAKKIILTRRYLYALCLGVVNAMILFATDWLLWIKIALFALGCLIFVFVWFFLRQRRKNVSRDAVEIEKKLAKNR